MAVHGLVDKLHDSRGETLVETLAAILIGALAVALLFTCVTASATINRSAKKADFGYGDAPVHQDGYYDAFTKAEKQDVSPSPAPSLSGKITVTAVDVSPSSSVTVNVKLYGGKGMYSYKEEVSGP